VRDLYRKAGWIAVKVSDSAVCDVLAVRALRHLPWQPAVLMIEVKGNASGGPYMNFRREDREALKADAAQAGAKALLVWWPPGGPYVEIPADQWP
jgi:hypothetical protein